MKIVLYMATSIDGFIAKKDGNSDWVSEIDSKNFEQKIAEMGCIIVGRRTFDQYQGELYPVEGITNIVISTNKSSTPSDNVIYANSPAEAVRIAQEKGHDKALLIGGGITNGLFLQQNLIDEVYLSVHPLILGNGIKLFENVERDINLEMLEEKSIGGGLTQLHYSVNKYVW